MPALAQAFPGFQERFARSAAHAQSAQRMLTELAAQDLAGCLDGDTIDVGQAARDEHRPRAEPAAPLVRHALAAHAVDRLAGRNGDPAGRGAPRRATAGDASRLPHPAPPRPPVHHAQAGRPGRPARPRRRRHLRQARAAIPLAGRSARWRFPDYGGTLYFDEAEQGVDPAWLRGQALQIDFRKGGERLKPAANRPTRSLKYHYQACDVPAWERTRLPIVSAGAACCSPPASAWTAITWRPAPVRSSAFAGNPTPILTTSWKSALPYTHSV